MSNTVVVALKLPNYVPSFSEQLVNAEVQIENICKQLAAKHKGEDWIIACPEYGFTNGKAGRYITSEQKTKLKELMIKLTKAHPNLSIVSTMATKRLIASTDKARTIKKILGIAEAYDANSQFEQSPEFLAHRQQCADLSGVNEDFNLVRNTAYVFSGGQCVARHDKRTPFKETYWLNNGIFRPGNKRSLANIINAKLGIEICMEHSAGILAKQKTPPPSLQLIVSNTTPLNLSHCVSPYVVHVDAIEPVQLITRDKQSSPEITLYDYNVATATLAPVEPMTRADALVKSIRDKLGSVEVAAVFDELLVDGQGHELLTKDHYQTLLTIAARYYCQYTRLSQANYGNLKKPLTNISFVLLNLLEKASPYANSFSEPSFVNLVLKAAILNHDLDLTSLLLVNYRAAIDDSLFKDKDLLSLVLNNKRQDLVGILMAKQPGVIQEPVVASAKNPGFFHFLKPIKEAFEDLRHVGLLGPM